jgi:hypothetical protein|tara:strand:+ start:308 stop:1132 length:825 start_codon:yes stop_codon:yes gene_type:complete
MESEKLATIESYYENMPYGNKSLSSEIHGPKNQATINEHIKTLVSMSDVARQQNQPDLAQSLQSGIYKISTELDMLKKIKEEHAADLRTRSNWTDHGWDDNAFTEQCIISFDDKMDVLITAFDPTSKKQITKKVDQITKDWVSIGDWMQTLSQAKQELVEARNDMGTAPPFDIDFFTNNLLKNNWKSILSDQDPTMDPRGPYRGFRLQQILHEDADANGNLPADYNLDKFSFDPNIDNRLHSVIAGELKRSFDPNYETEKEKNTAIQLMNRISS